MEILSFSKGDYMEKLYSFKARNKVGKIIKSSLSVKSEEEFKEILLKEKLFLISYKVKKKQKRINQKGIKKQEVINFLYKMSILLKSGVSITDSLENVIKGVNNKKFKNPPLIHLTSLDKIPYLSPHSLTTIQNLFTITASSSSSLSISPTALWLLSSLLH